MRRRSIDNPQPQLRSEPRRSVPTRRRVLTVAGSVGDCRSSWHWTATFGRPPGNKSGRIIGKNGTNWHFSRGISVPLRDRKAWRTWIYEFLGQPKRWHSVGTFHEAIDQQPLPIRPACPNSELCTLIVVHLFFACCPYCLNCPSPQGGRTIRTKGTGDGSAQPPPCPAVAAVHGAMALDHSLWPHDGPRSSAPDRAGRAGNVSRRPPSRNRNESPALQPGFA